MMRNLLMPLGQVFAGAVWLRNKSFNRGWRQTKTLAAPVVSVGNLTVGGTGKTPIIDHMLSWATARNLIPGVVSRGYGGRQGGESQVILGIGAARLYGDEPTMLAKRHPNIPIYVGADRVAVGEKLLAEHQVDIVFADDAFQHRQMHRDLDILVMDCTAPATDYRPLPWGLAREPMQSLSRADFVVLSKSNLVTSDRLDEIKNRIAAESPGLPVVTCDYGLLKPDPLPRAVMMVCGLGRPMAFSKTLSEVGVDVVAKKIYPDHHVYSKKDVKEILQVFADSGAESIAITEKDYVKLARFEELDPVLWVTQLELNFSQEIDALYEKIGSVLP